MALTTSSQVIEAGSLRWELFEGLTDTAELTALVDRWILVADAFVYRRVGASTYSDTTPQIVTMLAAAECYLCLAYLGAQAKARKVFGTHYSFDSEESQSYDNPLETEWRQLAIELLDEFAVIDEPGSAVALPVFLVSTDVDDTLTQSTPDDLDAWLDEARGFPIREVPVIR
jgi:hypothetical protein